MSVVSTSPCIAADSGGGACYRYFPLFSTLFFLPLSLPKNDLNTKGNSPRGFLYSTFCGVMKDETNYKIIIAEQQLRVVREAHVALGNQESDTHVVNMQMKFLTDYQMNLI